MGRPAAKTRRIDAIRPLHGDPNTVEVRVAGATVATMPRVRAESLALREGLAWTPGLASRADSAAAVALARESALALLARQPWGCTALERRLVRGGHAAGPARLAVEGLRADGWLDDVAYARQRIEHHRRKGPIAAEALATLLERDGIDAKTAREAARSGAATEREVSAEARRAKRAGETAAKVARRLARLGIDPDTIRQSLEDAGFPLDG